MGICFEFVYSLDGKQTSPRWIPQASNNRIRQWNYYSSSKSAHNLRRWRIERDFALFPRRWSLLWFWQKDTSVWYFLMWFTNLHLICRKAVGPHIIWYSWLELPFEITLLVHQSAEQHAETRQKQAASRGSKPWEDPVARISDLECPKCRIYTLRVATSPMIRKIPLQRIASNTWRHWVKYKLPWVIRRKFLNLHRKISRFYYPLSMAWMSVLEDVLSGAGKGFRTENRSRWIN